MSIASESISGTNLLLPLGVAPVATGGAITSYTYKITEVSSGLRSLEMSFVLTGATTALTITVPRGANFLANNIAVIGSSSVASGQIEAVAASKTISVPAIVGAPAALSISVLYPFI